MQEDEAQFAATTRKLDKAELAALSDFLRWVAEQPDEEEDATIRIIEALSRETRRARK